MIAQVAAGGCYIVARAGVTRNIADIARCGGRRLRSSDNANLYRRDCGNDIVADIGSVVAKTGEDLAWNLFDSRMVQE